MENEDKHGRSCRVLGKAGCNIGGMTLDRWIYEEALKRLSLSENDPMPFYEKAADAGSHLACDYLGWLYMTGSVVQQDLEKGLSLYRKAAEMGNARSMYALGYAYQCGQGVEISMDEAARWYEKAALAGHQNALSVYRVVNRNR